MDPPELEEARGWLKQAATAIWMPYFASSPAVGRAQRHSVEHGISSDTRRLWMDWVSVESALE